jgi:predicted AlkP superfamily phosphohydrolase/phosphomutase
MVRRSSVWRRTLLSAIILALLVTQGCDSGSGTTSENTGEHPESGGPRVVLIGVDGLDWGRVDSMIDAGRLPNIALLRQRGASGVLRSIPPFRSPSIWTSMATGKTEEKHGISGFLVGQGQTKEATPTSGNMRRVRAFWEIMSAAGRSVGVVAWLVTWPAEPVDGYMVSPNINRLLSWRAESTDTSEADERLAMAVYPARFADAVASCQVLAEDIPRERTTRLLASTEYLARDDVALEFSNLVGTYASDLTTLAIADTLRKLVPTRVRAIYLRGLDINCHAMWRYMDPSSWPQGNPPEMERTFSSVVEEYYAVADSMVGSIIDAEGDDAIFIVCSDHGFAGHRGYPGFEGDVAVGIDMHREDGLIIMAGPGIREGGSISGASVLDVAPTLLATVGLPAARDMDGRALLEAFDDDFLADHPAAMIDTYETGEREVADEAVESPVDDEIKEMLRSLGYIN